MKKYFMGNEISKYGLDNGYVDYRALANSFNHVLNNDIITNTMKIGDWDVFNGLDNDDDWEKEIFQYYIIDSNGADILKTYTNEIVYYSEPLDMYVWGVTHWGTSWDYVLTDIPIE